MFCGVVLIAVFFGTRMAASQGAKVHGPTGNTLEAKARSPERRLKKRLRWVLLFVSTYCVRND
jgi:hypothetical protein